MKTKRLTFVTLTAAALLLFSSAGWTADDDSEATIRLMGAAEAELPDAVTKQISIPEDLMQASDDAIQRAKDNSLNGMNKAHERKERREKGQMQAEDARERNAEMSEKTKETREAKGRANDDRPEPPETPETPPGQN